MADTDYSTEEWRDIPGWEGVYQASSLGRVRSLRKLTPTLLAQQALRDGRLVVCLSRDGAYQNRSVHRLVCAAFHGLGPAGTEVCHNDGDHTHNAPANLRWDTRTANANDARVHGTIAEGERHGKSKLTTEDVISIRRRVYAGENTRAVAHDFSVSNGNVRMIAQRQTWRHVKEP